MVDLSGQIIKSYRLFERLEVGGFGAVYRAQQAIVDREVAIKVILPRFASEPDFVRRFEAEARTIARMEHPHIVPLYDYWRDPDGAYLVMRWLRGGNLRNRLRTQGAIPLNEAVVILDQIAGALWVAHRSGIVHRDIKPENILLDEDGNGYLSDFGIALQAGQAEDSDSVTGSANYIAPEQLRSEASSPQSDIYSLGFVLYEMLLGEHPFKGSNITEIIFKQLEQPLPNITFYAPQLPEASHHVLQRATAKDPKLRYDTVLEFALAFKESIAGRITKQKTQTLEIVRELTNPFKGLRSFEEADSQDFFGRDQMVDQLLARLNEDTELAHFLAVVGASGSGKSSVVRAGLIPRLRSGTITGAEHWYVVDMIPGSTPLQNLEMALLRIALKPIPGLSILLQRDETALVDVVAEILNDMGGGHLLLFIDQFEELFTQVHDDAVRRQFLNLIYQAAIVRDLPLHIVITLRADFFDRPLVYGGIGTLIQQRTQVILPLRAAEIERAITGPSQRVGLDVDPELLAAIVADVREEPGALPLLQYALTELYERREGNRLTYKAYRETGGVQGALARRAQELYDSLDGDEQTVVRQIALRLVTLGEGKEDTRRRVTRSELYAMNIPREAVNTVLDQYGRYRLLTFDSDDTNREPTVEIAHEALIRSWDLLRHWLDENRNDIRLQRSLALAVDEWTNHGENNDYLLYGSRLLQFEEWQQQTGLNLTDRELLFLVASIEERSREEAIEAERQAREKALEQRTQRLLRMLVVVFAIGGVIAGIFGFLAVQQSGVAESARATSEANAQEARTQLAISQQRASEIQNLNLLNTARQALQLGDSGLAMALILQVNQSNVLLPTIQGAMYDVAYGSFLSQRWLGHTRKINAIAIAADGTLIATGSDDLAVVLWDVASGSVIATLAGHQGPVNNLVFSPDGLTLISGGTDGVLIVWDVAQQRELRRLQGHFGPVTDLAYLSDGQRVISSSADSTLILWDVNVGTMIQQYRGHNTSLRSVAVSPDGLQAVSAGRDAMLVVWDVATGATVRTLSGHESSVDAVVWSHDGASILSASADKTLILWSASDGAVLRRFEGHTEGVISVAISPDNRFAISTGCAMRDASRICTEGEVIEWDVNAGVAIRQLNGHQDSVNAVTYALNAPYAFTVSCGETRQSACILGEVLAWDVSEADDLIETFAGHASAVVSTAISADGSLALSGGGASSGAQSGDNGILLWDLTTNTLIGRFDGHTGDVKSLLFLPDNQRFISASNDGTVNLWDIASGDILYQWTDHSGEVYDIALSPDGTYLASVGRDGVIVWRAGSRDQVFARMDLGNQIVPLSIAYDQIGERLAVGLNNGSILVLSAVDGTTLIRLVGHTDAVSNLVFIPDQGQLLTASNDRTIRLWDWATATEIRRFEGHTGAITSLSMGAELLDFVSSSADGTVRFWDFETGQTIRTYAHNASTVFDVSTNATGQIAVSASADGFVRVWRVSLPALITWITENRYVRAITAEERVLLRLDN